MKSARRPTVLLIATLACLIGASSAQAALVYNDNGEFVGEFAGIFDNDPSFWVVYSPTLDRLFVIHGHTGSLHYFPDGCPYFLAASCTGEATLSSEWWRWITLCDSRYFRAMDSASIPDSPWQLTSGGGCTNSGVSSLVGWEAEEMLAGDFPFEIGRGPLQLVPGAAAQSLLAIPTTGRWGLVALALVLLWQGVRRLQKFAAHKP